MSVSTEMPVLVLVLASRSSTSPVCEASTLNAFMDIATFSMEDETSAPVTLENLRNWVEVSLSACPVSWKWVFTSPTACPTVCRSPGAESATCLTLSRISSAASPTAPALRTAVFAPSSKLSNAA